MLIDQTLIKLNLVLRLTFLLVLNWFKYKVVQTFYAHVWHVLESHGEITSE